MKFTKTENCGSCVLKCDVYNAVNQNGNLGDADIVPMHAHLKKHDMICKQGSAVTHALFLVKGSAKLYIEGLNNRNIILYILKPPAYIGLMSFFDKPVYAYSVAALEESKVCFVDLERVRKLYAENHDLLLNLNKAFGKSVSAIMKKIISLNQKQIRGRMAESLLYLAEINQANTFNLGLTRKEMGEMAAISEENTVRLLSELAREGIIALKGREIEILDMSILKKISEFG